MPISDQTPPAEPARPVSPGAVTSTSVARLMAAIDTINDIDVVNSPDDDREAVIELIDITTDEQRTNLLFALLVERMRAAG